MQEYVAKTFRSQIGIVKVVYAWTWLDSEKGLGRNINYVCLVDGLIEKTWGRNHPNARDYNGLQVLDISESNITMLQELTPLTKELL